MSYSVDTSALMNGWTKHYPPDVFETVWERIAGLIEEGRFLAPDEVLRELEKQEDDLHKWAKARSKMFLPLEQAIQQRAGAIANQFKSLVQTKTVMGGSADPFVIALAVERNLIVVTDEQRRPKNPRIPDVCDALGVRCIPLVQLFREEGWRV